MTWLANLLANLLGKLAFVLGVWVAGREHKAKKDAQRRAKIREKQLDAAHDRPSDDGLVDKLRRGRF